MKIDGYAHLRSPIHRWEQRSKLVGLLTLIFAFASTKNLILLPGMLGLTLLLFGLSRLPLSFLGTRLTYPGLLIVAIVLVLPWVTGETVIFSWGWLSLKLEGCLAVVLIITRFFCILTVGFVLFGTAPFTTSLKAMGALGIPSLLVDMTLLTYRYLEELEETNLKMQRAMKLRGFQSHKLTLRNLQLWASLTGTLLVRSYERSQRIYQAMILRGYGQNRHHYCLSFQGIDRYSWLALVLTLSLACPFFLY